MGGGEGLYMQEMGRMRYVALPPKLFDALLEIDYSKLTTKESQDGGVIGETWTIYVNFLVLVFGTQFTVHQL